MASAAFAGLGSVISINTGTSGAPVWVTIAELNEISQSGRQANTVNTTTFSSTAEEFLPVLPNSGMWSIKGNYVSDPGRTALESAFATKALKGFKIQLPVSQTETSIGDLFTFTALINDLNYTIGVQTQISFSCSLKVSGTVNITPGS